VLRKEELSSGCKTDCEDALLILPGRKRIRSEPSALNQVNNEHNDGNHEQKMDQRAANVADKAQKPEHHQDDNYSPEHRCFFRLRSTFVAYLSTVLFPCQDFSAGKRRSSRPRNCSCSGTCSIGLFLHVHKIRVASDKKR